MMPQQQNKVIPGQPLVLPYFQMIRGFLRSGSRWYLTLGPPPGHAVKVDRDAEFVLFSPQAEHTLVMDHINSKRNA